MKHLCVKSWPSFRAQENFWGGRNLHAKEKIKILLICFFIFTICKKKKKIGTAKYICYLTFSASGPGLFSGKLFATYMSPFVTFYLPCICAYCRSFLLSIHNTDFQILYYQKPSQNACRL